MELKISFSLKNSQVLPSEMTYRRQVKKWETRESSPRVQMQVLNQSYLRRGLNFGLLQWEEVTVTMKLFAIQKCISLLRSFNDLFNFPREVSI